MIRILALLAFASPVAAQEFTADGHWVDRCLAIQDDPMVCVGREADRCAQEHSPGPDMVYAACFEAEAVVWDKALNAAYRELVRLARQREGWDLGYEPDALIISLRDMQRAWITYRDAVCANATALAKPFGSAAGPAFAECNMVQTAQQFFVLNDMRHEYLQ